MRKLAFSVGIDDCRTDTFRSGGKGGQNQNVRDTGVRIVHVPSGAVGESREERSQLQNKRTAFRRMAEHPKFKLWVHEQLRGETPEEWVEKQLAPSKIKTEFRTGNGWQDERALEGSGR